jgi:hypothetical protein
MHHNDYPVNCFIVGYDTRQGEAWDHQSMPKISHEDGLGMICRVGVV